MLEFPQQRFSPRTLIDRLTDMAVEVAVRTQREAEGPMDVERDVVFLFTHAGAKQASIRARKAIARCEIACFASGSISAKVC